MTDGYDPAAYNVTTCVYHDGRMTLSSVQKGTLLECAYRICMHSINATCTDNSDC